MLRRLLDGLYLSAGYLAGLFLIAIFVLMMVMSVGRLVRVNLPDGDLFVSWSMAATAFLGLAHTFKAGEMIRVGLLIDRVRGPTRWWFEIVSLTVGVAFIGFFTWHAANFLRDSWRFGDMATGVIPNLPIWIPQLGFVVGLLILFIAFVDEFVHVARGGVPRYEKPPPTSAEEVVERAVSSGV